MGFTADTRGRRVLTLRFRAPRDFLTRSALLVGLIVGFVVSVDAVVVHSIPGTESDLHRMIPFLLTTLVAVVVAAALTFAKVRRRLFARRFDIVLVAIMVAITVSGVGGKLEATDVVVPLALLFWLFAAIVEQRPVRVPLLALILALLLAICCVASIANGGVRSMFGMVRPAKVILLTLLVTDLIDGERRCRLAVRWFVILAVLSGAAAIVTGIFDVSAGISLTAWNAAEFQEKATPFGMLMRATALLPTAQVLAHFLILGVALLLTSPVRPVWKVSGVLVLSVGILWTFSTGAYAVLAITLLAWVFLRRPERSIHYAVILIGLVLLGSVMGVSESGWSGELLQLGSKPAHDRVVQIRNGVAVIAAHPILGNGVASSLRSAEGGIHIHNAYLQAAAEAGIPAALVLIGILLCLATAAAIKVPRLPSGEDRDRVKGVLLGVIVLAIHWNAEPFLYSAVSWLFIGIGTGIVAHYARELRGARSPVGSSPAPTAGPERAVG